MWLALVDGQEVDRDEKLSVLVRARYQICAGGL